MVSRLLQPCALETRGHVASLALAAVLPEVHIVLRMAGVAVLAQLHLVGRLPVAVRAGDAGVRTGKREFSRLAVVELPEAPSIRRVTALAVLAECTLVPVVALVAAVAVDGSALERRRHVAGVARDHDVQADEGEFGQVVVEHHVLAPTIDAMAGRAVGAKLAAVRVARAVAGAAVGAELLLRDHARVACIAIERLVAAHELELTVTQVIERGWLPGGCAVAFFAGGPETGCVGIVGSVAACAIAGQRVLHVRSRMACLAGQLCVGAGQRKVGLFRVVELRGLPGDRRVAARAVGAPGAAVHVVRGMTGGACRGRSSVAVPGMARGAGNVAVRVAQHEVRLAVIESCARPGRRLVTVAAGRAEFSTVRVGRLVAVDATGWCLTEFSAGLVAGIARGRGMRSSQRKISPGVIERRTAELDDVRVAALVFGVAGFALRRVDCRQAAVKAGVPTDVGRDVLVAGHAKSGLAGPVGAIVALGTLRLELCVRVRDLAWHEQRLNTSGKRALR